MGSNVLHDQRSPYLLQNAQSPVHWYPWGQKAFDEAQKNDKPIFLSMGFSASHWCRVMDVKYFKEGEIKILNEKFVCIKVDREERPDVAKVYESYFHRYQNLSFIHWPLGFFLYPDLRPFRVLSFNSEYVFADVLSDVAWNLNYFCGKGKGKGNGKGRGRGSTLTQVLSDIYYDLDSPLTLPARDLKGKLTTTALYRCASQVASRYDERTGGLGSFLTFCRPVEIQLMLCQSKALRDSGRLVESNKILEMVNFTLQCMARWGIHDHIGGGFHRIGPRYRRAKDSVYCRAEDSSYGSDILDWAVPHFEKMLYDQGQLANVYLNVFSLTNDPFFSRVSCGILDFLRRELKGESGEFFSAVGAESVDGTTKEEVEGAFYIWTSTEVDEILGEKATLFKHHYNIQPSGNCFLHKMNDGKELTGKNVLIETTVGMVKSKHDIQYRFILEECRKKLFDERSRRPRPDKDEMVIVSWNGLVISSLARASKILKDEPEGTLDCHPREYIKVAEAAASFIQENLYKKGRLYHGCFKKVLSEAHGFLDDYAFLISGLLDLYEFGGELKWLVWATDLQDVQDKLFLDEVRGGYYYTADKEGPSILRVRDYYDDSVPSGNSVSVINLQRLASMVAGLKSRCYRQKAQDLLASFGRVLKEKPMEVPLMCMLSVRCREMVVLVRHKSCIEYENMLVAAHAFYNPNRTVIHMDTSDTEDMKFWEEHNCHLAALAKKTRDQFSEVVSAFVLQGRAWSGPITGPRLLKALLYGEKRGVVQKKRKRVSKVKLPPVGAIWVDIKIAQEIGKNHLPRICGTTHAKFEIIYDVEETGNPFQMKIVIKGTNIDQIQLGRDEVFKVIEKLENEPWKMNPFIPLGLTSVS